MTNWPDPARPGVPLNFEKDGWHWLKTERGLAPWRWKENPESIMWESGWEAGDGVISPAYFAALGPCTYLGPVLTPDEATALQARADRNAAGFARVDAEAERAKFLHKQEIAALQKRAADLEAKLNLLMGPPPDKVNLRAGMIAAGVSEKTADEILRSPAFNRAALTGGKDV